MSDTENQVEALRDGAEVALDATLELGAENQRLRERVAEWERIIRDPEAVRVNLLRGTIVSPPGLAWLGDSDGPVAELRARAEKAERERDAARAEAAMLREALGGLLREEWMTYEGNLEATGHTSVDDLNAARTALAASPGDWLAAHDRAFAERVREAVLGKPMDLPKDNAAWCTSCLENVQTAVEVRANALDLDALVGGKS